MKVYNSSNSSIIINIAQIKSVWILVCILLFNFAANAALNQRGKETYFILHNVATVKDNVATIFNPDKYNLVLIISESREKLLKDNQRQYFNYIIVVPTYTFEVIKPKVYELINKYKLQRYEFLSYDEYSMGVLGQLRDEFNTKGPGFSSINRFLTKTIMKESLNNKVNIPKYVSFEPEKYLSNGEIYTKEVIRKLGFPIFIKPTNGTGSSNTDKITSSSHFRRWANSNTDKTSFELDEFIEGEPYHIDSLIYNGEVIFAQVSKIAFPCFDFLKGKPLGSIILIGDTKEIQMMKEFNSKVIKAMWPVPNGATHLEAFKKKNGDIYFIEIAARIPGAMIPSMYEKYHGFRFEEMHFKLQMGQKPAIKENPKKYYAAWVSFPIKKGIVKAIYHPFLKSQSEFNWNIKLGDKLSAPEELKDSAMTVLIWNENYTDLKQDFKYLTTKFNPFDIQQ